MDDRHFATALIDASFVVSRLPGWFPPHILARGRDYVRQGAVRDLAYDPGHVPSPRRGAGQRAEARKAELANALLDGSTSDHHAIDADDLQQLFAPLPE